MPRPRKYLIQRGIRLVFQSGRPIAHVAKDLGLPAETLRKRVRQVEADQGLRPDLPSSGAGGDQAAQAGEARAGRRVGIVAVSA
jgi:transposase